MQKVACLMLSCSMGTFHTFFHIGAVLITVLVGVSKAVFLLVGRYIKQKKGGAVSVLSGQGIISYGLISASSGSNWPLNTVWERWQKELILDKMGGVVDGNGALLLNEEDQSFELTN